MINECIIDHHVISFSTFSITHASLYPYFVTHFIYAINLATLLMIALATDLVNLDIIFVVFEVSQSFTSSQIKSFFIQLFFISNFLNAQITPTSFFAYFPYSFCFIH